MFRLDDNRLNLNSWINISVNYLLFYIFAKISFMSITKITIVRHGETEWNKAIRLQGHQDSSLTQKGIEQAEQLAETIHLREFDLLISSDLGRVKHTTRIINKHLNLKVIENKNLRERAFGVMEGRSLDYIESNFPDVHKAYMTRDAEFPIPEGESLVQFNQRIVNCINTIAKDYSGKSILVIAHGGVLDCVFRKICGIDLGSTRIFSVYNTSVNSILINNGEWKLEEWGNIEHLNNAEVLDEIK